jgi:hypothetical protein
MHLCAFSQVRAKCDDSFILSASFQETTAEAEADGFAGAFGSQRTAVESEFKGIGGH